MAERRPDELVLSELTEQLDRTRRLLSESPEEVARRALESLAGPEAEADGRIAARMANRAALAQPDVFGEAHRLVVHSLEVLDGEGSRNPKVRGFWFLDSLVEVMVEFVAEYIVQAYAKNVAGRLRTLYARREAQSPPRSTERRLLRPARIEMDRLAASFGGGAGAGIVVLAGGALLPALASVANLFGAFSISLRGVLIALAVVTPVFFVVSFVLLRGAAIAHRRSRLIMSQPLAALWGAVGNAGNPPEDDAATFATVAILLTAVTWFALPAIAIVAYLLFD